MNRVSQTFLVLLICAVSVHCGGGGGSSGGGGVIQPPAGTPTFVSDGNCTTVAVRLVPGTVNGTMFDVAVMVTTDVASFYGAGFGITFSGATFVGVNTGVASFLDGLPNDIRATLESAGVVKVDATITAQQAGITPSATVPLVTLTFQATGDGPFVFQGAAERQVQVCTSSTTCQEQAGVCWDDATLTLI